MGSQPQSTKPPADRTERYLPRERSEDRQHLSACILGQASAQSQGGSFPPPRSRLEGATPAFSVHDPRQRDPSRGGGDQTEHALLSHDTEGAQGTPSD